MNGHKWGNHTLSSTQTVYLSSSGLDESGFQHNETVRYNIRNSADISATNSPFLSQQEQSQSDTKTQPTQVSHLIYHVHKDWMDVVAAIAAMFHSFI